MENFSYEYNGTVYDFVLTLKAKVELEKLQKRQLQNPVVAKLALNMRNSKGELDVSGLSDEQLMAILPHIDELGEIDPFDVGYILLSNYQPYRGNITRELFDALVEDMEAKSGLEWTFEFFVRLQQSVFTRLEALQKIQENRTVSKANFQKIQKA